MSKGGGSSDKTVVLGMRERVAASVLKWSRTQKCHAAASRPPSRRGGLDDLHGPMDGLHGLESHFDHATVNHAETYVDAESTQTASRTSGRC